VSTTYLFKVYRPTLYIPFHSISSFYLRQRGPYTEARRYKQC